MPVLWSNEQVKFSIRIDVYDRIVETKQQQTNRRKQQQLQLQKRKKEKK